jgi:LEA14-like dessication related protein
MKNYVFRLILFLFAFIFSHSIFAQENSVEIREKKIDFGEVSEGEMVEKTFEIINRDETPLIIHDIAVTCGCTVPEWTKTPVKSGEKTFIKVRFDTNGKTGRQNKSITLLTNAKQSKIALLLTGIVLPKP